jgi:molecular chaperone DnaK
MKDMEDKLSEEEKTEVTTAIDELKSEHSERNVETIKEKMDNVNSVFQKISEKLYSQKETMEDMKETMDGMVNDVEFEEVK